MAALTLPSEEGTGTVPWFCGTSLAVEGETTAGSTSVASLMTLVRRGIGCADEDSPVVDSAADSVPNSSPLESRYVGRREEDVFLMVRGYCYGEKDRASQLLPWSPAPQSVMRWSLVHHLVLQVEQRWVSKRGDLEDEVHAGVGAE